MATISRRRQLRPPTRAADDGAARRGSEPPARWGRAVAVGVLVGVCACAWSYSLLADRGFLAGDFSWPYRGAQRLLAGHDPYNDPAYAPGRPYPFENQLPYPMPAVVEAIPFSYLPPYWAGALFFGLGSGLLATGIAARGAWRRLALFASPSFYVAAVVAQWSPLVMAAAFLPWLQPLAIGKPNIALPVLALWFRARWFAVAAAFALATLLLDPRWPIEWLRNTDDTGHLPPLLIAPGFVLLLGLLAWRAREGRLLLWLAVTPQFLFFYDQLLLFLIPRTLRQSLTLLVVEWLAYEGWGHLTHSDDMGQAVLLARPWVIFGFYFPALALVLWQARRATAPVGDTTGRP